MSFFFLRAFFSILIAVALSCPAPAETQQDVYQKSLEFMQSNEWADALNSLQPYVDRYPPTNAYQKFGPKFGWFWYHRGYCEARLGHYQDAIRSYQTCYQDFPNTSRSKSYNKFQIFALYKWGEAAFANGDYLAARQKFLLFLKERRPRQNPQDGKFPKGRLQVHLAICFFKTGDISQGSSFLKTAIQEKTLHSTPPAAIFSGFDALVEAGIKSSQEQLILDFLKVHKQDFMTHIFISHQYSKRLLSRAKEAINAGMFIAPFELMSLVPNSRSALHELRALLKSLKGLPSDKQIQDGNRTLSVSRTQDLIERLETELRGAESNQALILSLSAYIWSKLGNQRASYVAFKQLESQYPQSAHRESNLFNLIQCCQKLGRMAEAESYSNLFLQSFPESSFTTSVRQMMVTGLYYNQKYAECIETSSRFYLAFSPTTPPLFKDSCLFSLGASHFYLGQFQPALKYLEQHVSLFPKSTFRDQALFLEASSLLRLNQFESASEKLDHYLSATAETRSEFYPYAFFERAYCFYSQNAPERALEQLQLLETQFPQHEILHKGYNLQGHLHYSLGDSQLAETFYKKAYQFALNRQAFLIGGEYLNNLIALLSNQKVKRPQEVVNYYEQYWKLHAQDSPYQAQVAFASFPSMKVVGRAGEGLLKLQEVLASIIDLPDQPALESLIYSYRDAYLEIHSLSQLNSHFTEFAELSPLSTRSLFKVALIDAYSKLSPQKLTNSSSRHETVQVLFQELQQDYALSDLSPYGLLKVGTYLHQETVTPREAIPFYQELLTRKGSEYQSDAMLGLADLYADSSQEEEQAEAKRLFSSLSSTPNVKSTIKEKGLFRLLQLAMKRQEWNDANAHALVYITHKNFSRYRAQVRFFYAQSFDKVGKAPEALSAYMKVYGANQGNVSIAAPAMKRLMELYWARNSPQKVSENGSHTISDRQTAYDLGSQYIQSTQRHLTKMTQEEKALWNATQALVHQYLISGEVVEKKVTK